MKLEISYKKKTGLSRNTLEIKQHATEQPVSQKIKRNKKIS